jgi:hypothetical protein
MFISDKRMVKNGFYPRIIVILGEEVWNALAVNYDTIITIADR